MKYINVKDTWSSNRLLLLHPFNGLFSRTTWVSRYLKGKTSLDFIGARDNGVWGWQYQSTEGKSTED